jgi:protocatechuate 3,4-dioxygenase beta subunit
VALIAFVAIVVAVIARNAARTAAGVAPATEVELANAAPAATASEPLAKLENRRATVAPDSISPKARGRVLDSEEKPVADAVIEFHARASHGLDLNLGGFGADDRVIARVKSDPEGAWIAELPAAGAFELEAHASGFGLVLVEGVAAGDDVAIHMERAALFTLIVKETHGVPLREAILELRKPGASQPFLCARTDERGSWHFQELPPGPWSIIARSEDRAGQAHIAFGAHAGESLERELVLPGGTALEGTIVRAGDGAALADVELSLGREATTLARSDALGHFRIEGIFEAPGSCDVRAHVRGFRAAIQRVRLEVGKIANVQLALEPGVSATGQVVDERGVAIAQAWVVAWREDASEESSAWDYAEAQSDARGRFQLSDLGADRDYALLVRAPGRASELRAMRCSASEAKIELEPIVVTAGASLAGRVLSADESAYPDAEIVVLRLDGPGSNAGANSPNSTAITIGVNPALDAPRPPELDASRVKSVRTRVRPDGSFRVVDLAPGSYRVTARSIDLRVIDRREITLAPGAALDGMEFRTSEGGSISGRVLDPDRRPLGGAWVLLMKEGRFIETRSAPVDADGRFSFDALEDLRYWVSASYARSGPDGRPEHPFTRCDVHDLGLGAKGVELVLGRTAKLTGRVVDTNGHGLAGAIVDAADETKFHYQAVTDAEGEFTMNVPEASRLALGASWAEHNGGIRVSGRLEDVAAASVDVVIRLD